jgi:hypothetical protein
MRPIDLAVAALLVLPACARPPAETPPGAQEETTTVDKAAITAAVTALIEDWSKAGQEARYDDLKALYADETDFYWVENGRVAYADRAAVAAGVDQLAALNPLLRSSATGIVVTPLGADIASFRAAVEIGLVSADFSFDFAGVFTGVAVRRDGAWRFLQGHLSKADAPAGEGDAR